MKKTAVCSLLLASILASGSLFAGTSVTTPTSGGYTKFNGSGTDEVPSAFPFEFDLEAAYIGESAVKRGERVIRDFEELHTLARFIYTPRIMFGILRLGVAWERYSFDLPDRLGGPSNRIIALSYPGPVLGPVRLSTPQIPDTLQSVSAVIGLDTQLAEGILIRLEAQPGFYGTDHLGGNTFNIPFVLGGTYIYSSNVQFIFGASIDYERKYPVFPGGGVRWRFAPQWMLDATAPSPRLVYEMTPNLSLYAGANLKGGSYRTDKNFGNSRGDRRLNNAVLTYFEFRTGAGVEWKVSSDIRLTVEGGYMPYRTFDFHRADVRYRHDSGAPYGMIAVRAAF
ncbi:hypothetical protein BH20VER2_BH20VER2_15790 [soil metagenome]|nr:hypothetical protein [Chthoniobacterales bacterium]